MICFKIIKLQVWLSAMWKIYDVLKKYKQQKNKIVNKFQGNESV